MMKSDYDLIRSALTENNSKTSNDVLVEAVLQKPEMFDLYWGQYALIEEPVSRKAAWVIYHVILKMPQIVEPYIEELVSLVPNLKHDGEKRTAAKIFSLIDIPEKYIGFVIEQSFLWLTDTNESIAVKALSIDTIVSLCEKIPELIIELAATLQTHYDTMSPGLKNKADKALRKFNVII